jgi:hypothetical protein
MHRRNRFGLLAPLAGGLLAVTLAWTPAGAAGVAGNKTVDKTEIQQRLRRIMGLAAAEGFTGVVLVARQGTILLHEG